MGTGTDVEPDSGLLRRSRVVRRGCVPVILKTPAALASGVSRAPVLVALAAALLLLNVLGAPAAGSGPVVVPPPSRTVAMAAQPAGNTSINDEIDLTGASPTGTFPSGTVVRVSLRFSVNSSSSDSSQATIYVPQLQAVFPAVPASVQLFPPGVNVTVGFGSEVTADTGTFTLRNQTTFNTSGKVTFTSELAALMGSEPFGELTILDQWNWSVTTPTGVVTSSGWGPTPSQVIHPAEYANLLSLGPRSFTVPSPITACLTGPVQGRTFSLHAETPKPVDDFVANTTRDPVGGPSTFCLTIVIPTNITPQPLLVHVWDYESVTLLLYIVKVTVVNATTNGSGSGSGIDWTEYADIGAIVGVLAVAVGVFLLLRRTPPPPPPPPPTTAPPPT
jgi:hypothetical protein